MRREAPLSVLALVLLALPLLVPAMPAAAASVDLVPNGGFETKSSATATLPDRWNPGPALTNRVGAAARSPLESVEGGFSLLFVAASRPVVDSMFVRSDLVAFPQTCGGEGTFTFQADVLEGALQGAVEYYRADGSWIRSDVVPAAANAGWTTYAGSFRAPEETVRVAFTFAVTSILGAVAHVDDVHYTVDASPYRFCETWENGLASWWIETPGKGSIDCTRSTDGRCSLALAVDCCSSYVRVSKNLSVPLLATQTLSFDFQGSSTSGDRNALIQLRFDGAAVNVDWTYGPSCCNNGLNIINYDQPGQSTTVPWTQAGRWYRVEVVIDGSTHKIHGRLIDLSTGTLVGTTSSIGFVGTTLQGISVQQVMWSSSTTTHHVDRLRLT